MTASQVRYQVRLLTRTPRTIYSAFLLPALLVVALSLAGSKSSGQQVGVAVGIAAFAIVSTAYATHATGLVAARDRGVLRRLRGTPLLPAAYFAGRITATVLLATAAAAGAFIVAQAILGIRIPSAAIPGLLVTSVMGALCWASLGTAATRLVPEPEAAWAILSASYLPLVFISGVFFPTSAEPSWLASVARWLPMQPMVQALGTALQPNTSLPQLDLRSMGVLAAWAAVGLVVALKTFAWERRPARKRKPGHC